MTEPNDPPPPRPDSQPRQVAAEEMLRAYYARLVTLPEVDRSQAQAAAALTSGVAAAIFAIFGSTVADLDSKLLGITFLAVVACWLASAACYVFAVAGDKASTVRTYEDTGEWMDALVAEVSGKRTSVGKWSRRGRAMMIPALVLSLLLVGGAHAERAMAMSVQIHLKREALREMPDACRHSGASPHLEGTVHRDWQEHDFFEIETSTECGHRVERTMFIRRADVAWAVEL
jgi:hypothetical protein